MSFAMFLGAKIKRIIYIASDLSKNFSLFNNKLRAIITQKKRYSHNFVDNKLVRTRLPLYPKSGLSVYLLRPISSSARSGPGDALLLSVRLSAGVVECPGFFVRIAVDKCGARRTE